jgi:hypothetical protein
MHRREYIEFDGDTVKCEQMLIFEMMTDANDSNCAFCTRVYDDNGRWDVMQCGELTQANLDPDDLLGMFNICTQCREHSQAVRFIRESSTGRICLKNVSNDGMFRLIP